MSNDIVETEKIKDDGVILARHIGEGEVGPEKLQAGTGTAWDAKEWTPTLFNMTLGNGTLIAKYTQVGNMVTGFFYFVFGSTSTIAANCRFSLPVQPCNDYVDVAKIGLAHYEDFGNNNFQGPLGINGSNARFYVIYAAGTYGNGSPVTNAIPFTFGTNDYIFATFSYLANVAD